MNIRTILLAAILCHQSNLIQCLQLSKSSASPRFNSSISPTTPYLTTIANWASKNQAALVATALGVTGVLGYFLAKPLANQIQMPARVVIPPQPYTISRQHEIARITRNIYVPYQTISPQLPIAHTLQTPTVQVEELERAITGYPLSLQQPQHEISRAEERTKVALATRKEKKEKGKHERYLVQEAPLDPIFMKQLQKKYMHPEIIIIQYNNGRRILHAIMQDIQAPLTKNDVRDLLWFLYLEAVISKSQHYKFFDEGTFLINGQESQVQKLYTALEKSGAEPYKRMSSHYAEWFPHILDLFAHTGIDVHNLPPVAMGTIVFAKDPLSSRLYIKPEEHGTARLSDLSGHTISYLKSLASKKLPQETKDFLAYLITLPKDVSETVRKERVDVDLYKEAVNLVTEAERLLGSKNIAELQVLMKTEGIRVIYPKIIDYITSEQIKKENPELYAKIESFYQARLKPFEKDWQMRKGNEIIFTIDELLKAPAIKIEKDLTSEAIAQEQQAFYYNQ